MTSSQMLTAVELRELLNGATLRDQLKVHHLAAGTVPVRNLVLIADIEEIVTSQPDSVLFLNEHVALGGWMVSAAIRMSWERRAAALVVPQHSFTQSVVSLAERLDVSLLSSVGVMNDIALAFAVQVGSAQARTLARLRAAGGQLSELDSLVDIMGYLTETLQARVSLHAAHSGTEIQKFQSREASPGSEVSVEVDLPLQGKQPQVLRALVTERQAAYAQELLSVAAPYVALLALSQRLHEIERSINALSITALLGLSTADTRVLDSVSLAVVQQLERDFNGLQVICLTLAQQNNTAAALVIEQEWRRSFPQWPLIRCADAWIVLTSRWTSAQAKEHVRKLNNFSAQLGPAVTLGIGLSSLHSTPIPAANSQEYQQTSNAQETLRSLQEAWLAAHIATTGIPVTGHDETREVLAFDEISVQLVPRVLPRWLAAQLAETWMPDLMLSPQRHELITAVLAFLDSHGSVTKAAKALDIHRNTMQQRLNRAQDLGVNLEDPTSTLALHLVLHVIHHSTTSHQEENADE